jgi:hypothetical protein
MLLHEGETHTLWSLQYHSSPSTPERVLTAILHVAQVRIFSFLAILVTRRKPVVDVFPREKAVNSVVIFCVNVPLTR